MAVKRPGFTPNVRANMRVLESKKLFVDIKPDTTRIARFLPSSFEEDGRIFVRAMNHYNFKQPDDRSRGMALACLREHGTPETGDDCWVCRLYEASLKLKGDPIMDKIAKQQGGHPARPRFYAQVLLGEKMDSGIEYTGPFLLALPKTPADDVVSILQSNEAMGEPFVTDPDEGQALLITRTGAGLQTRYRVERSGRMSSLDEIFPEWTEKFLDADGFYEKLALNVATVDEQKLAAKMLYEESIDWAMLEKDFNL